MSTSIEFGCIHCGQNLNTRSPDMKYTEANRKLRTIGTWFDWFDKIDMNVNCSKCNKNNLLFWYKPLNNFWNWNQY